MFRDHIFLEIKGPPVSQTKQNSLVPGQAFGEWTLVQFIGDGGNGDVWKVSSRDGKHYAMKILRKLDKEAYARFKFETEALNKLGEMDGIIPMLDKHLPDNPKEGKPWFVMPLAIPFGDYARKKNPVDLVRDLLTLARTIEQLHLQGISHRDIKPANFLYLDGRLYLSDFGLVKYPERQELTPEKRDVGAKFTMAPEMRRHASVADGLPADVYSFAKSLWIALSGQELGFDGQYNTTSVLSLRKHLPGTYTTTLDQLLAECTDTEPTRRPTMATVIQRIEEWLDTIVDFHRRNLSEWSELTRQLFPLVVPARAAWSDIDDICVVLGEIAKIPALNHMFYPTGGGNTITGASRSAEHGMIELRVGDKLADILKPAKLTYESFGTDSRWSYFRLEAAPVAATGTLRALDSAGESEALTEIAPGEYIPYENWDAGEYRDAPLPAVARPVTRFLKGSFVFFSTRSVYNQDPSTYDARHNRMTEDQFREYIRRHAELVAAKS